MSDYEWDGWLDERLVVFGVNGQEKKREKKKAHEEDTHRFRFLFFSRSSSETDREGRRRRKRRIGIRLKTENGRKAVVILSLHKRIRQKQLATYLRYQVPTYVSSKIRNPPTKKKVTTSQVELSTYLLHIPFPITHLSRLQVGRECICRSKHSARGEAREVCKKEDVFIENQ